MIVKKFRIEIDGSPVRLYTNSRTQARCIEPDAKLYSIFAKASDANKKAVNWGLSDFAVVPFTQDIGTVTPLPEIGL